MLVTRGQLFAPAGTLYGTARADDDQFGLQSEILNLGRVHEDMCWESNYCGEIFGHVNYSTLSKTLQLNYYLVWIVLLNG